jgi:threonine dehydrogenase-like Zn-dependent dehydrogenase
MRAAHFVEPHHIDVGDRPDAAIAEPTDAVVRVVLACVCAPTSGNKGVRSGSAPARAYIPELLEDVLEGRINPGRVLDYATDLDGIADAYAAMDERRAIKSLVRVRTL